MPLGANKVLFGAGTRNQGAAAGTFEGNSGDSGILLDGCVYQFWDITVTGAVATYFGDGLNMGKSYGDAMAANGSGQRCVTHGMGCNGYTAKIDYVTVNSKSNASFFGNMENNHITDAMSNNTNNRACFTGGRYSNAYDGDIDYVNISSTGNASNFGSLCFSGTHMGTCSNGTSNRALTAGAWRKYGGPLATMCYFNMGSTGNASNFGSLATATGFKAGTSSLTNNRALWAGGTSSSSVEYSNISSGSSTSSFGNVPQASGNFAGGLCSNGTAGRAVGVVGYDNGSGSYVSSSMYYVSISSTSNSSDFGTLYADVGSTVGCESNST